MQNSVAGILADGAAAHPERTLFSFSGGDGLQREHYTYGSFLQRVNEVAAALKENGVHAGDAALVVYPPGLDMAVAFFACVWIGAVPVPAPPPLKARSRSSWSRLAHIARHAGARFGLAPADLVRRAAGMLDDAGTGLSAVRWIATDTVSRGSGILPPQPSEILFVQYTSGSTSAPRGVAVTNANVLHNARLCVQHDRPIGVSWLPHFHDMGLLGYFLYSLVRDGEAHCFSPVDFLRRPLLWFEMITRVRATITTAPNAAYEYCLREDKIAEADLDHIDLSSLLTMANCAEPVRAGTFERFRERFSRRGLSARTYAAGYGLAEHTLCVTFGGRRRLTVDAPEGAPKERSQQLISCGSPAPDVDLRIVDVDSRRPVKDGVIGEIWVDSPSKAAGYWRLPEATREHFEARLANDANSRAYLRTGDLGFVSDGELYVCGRLRDMLVLNGRNIFPADIEALIEEQFTRSLAGRVVAFGIPDPEAGTEQLVILVEAGAADAPGLDAIRLAVENGTGVAVGTIARVPRGTIVRTSSGKIARAQCSDNWREGRVDPIETLADDAPGAATDVPGMIAMLVARAQALGEADATLDQLGLDSIALVNFSLALESLLEEEGFASPELLERAADLSLLQAVRVSDLQAAHAMLRSGTIGAEAIVRLLNEVAGHVRGEEHARMLADSELPLPTIVSSPFAGGGDDVFLTGATGFLGAHLLRSLLELTDDRITVLVRGNSPLHAIARIRHALLETDMPVDAARRALHARVEVVPGDLSRPRFGLAESDYDRLSRSVSRIYHCGAEVDYVKSYNLLRATNVEATREVIALASRGRSKSLHYLSTTFVFGWSVKPLLLEDDRNSKMENLDFGYAQSKWVAEQLVLRAADAGLPAVIYRPSLVTASATGRFVRRDIVARVLGYMIRHGLTVDATNQISFLPVDVCAQNIVALSRSESAPPVVHMTSDEYHNIGGVCRVIGERFGYPFRAMGLAEFVAHAHAHCTSDDELYPLLSFLDRNTPRILRMGSKRYDSSAYRAARDGAQLALPHPDLAATVDPIVKFLQNEGLVPESPRKPRPRSAEPVGRRGAELLA